MGDVSKLIRDYRDLRVWQGGRAIVKEIYEFTKALPSDERFGLTNQMRRAAVSIPSNIAEGHSRGRKEYAHFLAIAIGSVAELETQVILSKDLGYVDSIEMIEKDLYRLRSMLGSLRSKIAS